MKTNSLIPRMVSAGIVSAITMLPAVARACDACMGGKDPTIRPAVNWAIFFMLGMVTLMATGVGLFIRYLARRARVPMLPHDELIQMMTLSEGSSHV